MLHCGLGGCGLCFNLWGVFVVRWKTLWSAGTWLLSLLLLHLFSERGLPCPGGSCSGVVPTPWTLAHRITRWHRVECFLSVATVSTSSVFRFSYTFIHWFMKLDPGHVVDFFFKKISDEGFQCGYLNMTIKGQTGETTISSVPNKPYGFCGR